MRWSVIIGIALGVVAGGIGGIVIDEFVEAARVEKDMRGFAEGISDACDAVKDVTKEAEETFTKIQYHDHGPAQ